MTTGTSSGNSSRTERSVEQVEDSVGSDMGIRWTKETPGNTRQCIWLVTEYCWNIEPEKYWEGAKRKISTVCFASFSELPVVCVCSF